MAWDCATGNGQAAKSLGDFFDTVVLSDGSEEQVMQFGVTKPDMNNLFATVMLAEKVALKPTSMDLVVVAQALHWFNLDAFFAELDRVLKPGGLFAAWSYGIHHVNEAVDTVVGRLYEDIIGSYWPEERHIVENHYRDITFPYPLLDVPQFELSKSWSIEQLLGYMNSWSAVQRYRADAGQDPLALIREELQRAWGGEQNRIVSWPLTLKVCKKV